MQMVKKAFFFVFLTLFFILLFMPKVELYHTLEKTLAKQDIRLNEKTIEKGLFSLTVKDITLYIKGIAIAHIESIEFRTYLFYSRVMITNISIDESLHKQVPAQTDEIKIQHSVSNPLFVSLDANGSFGSILGEIALKERDIKIDFIESKDISMLKAFLTKGEKGWSYEKSF
ncbi:hypothetical protein MNB_SV-13-777 [hydrothermal vent metagenome]|uniref:Uncharacterized protein n=1 Tax=hydrothermal vent metagenome TaxID=652676 RepID=A0A1W1CZN9_9ZZZZ